MSAGSGVDRQEERWHGSSGCALGTATDETIAGLLRHLKEQPKAEEAARRAEQRVQETMKRIEQRKHGWSGMGGVFNGCL
jgi:predicted secreted Zn-dependent protease